MTVSAQFFDTVEKNIMDSISSHDLAGGSRQKSTDDHLLEAHLAPYATHSARSQGRVYPEVGLLREFHRDRERVIRSGAFRRLQYKTQVFANYDGDMFRTRLTHSLEVAQLARSIAECLQLNEDLVDSIALVHDLGHTPFGHAGQDALNACMRAYGGFEHNLQSLRIVDVLEHCDVTFDGLNLTFEVREGILKHCTLEHAKKLGDIGRRFIENKQPTLEAQLVNIADEIAYTVHDIDDGLRAGLITGAQLRDVDFYSRHYQNVKFEFPKISEGRVIHETLLRVINALSVDLRNNSLSLILQRRPQSVDDVRNTEPLIALSKKTANEFATLKGFLFENMYMHYQIKRMNSKGRHIITDLFDAFMEEPVLLPPQFRFLDGTLIDKARKVADYISGMTDRYAICEHRRLYL
ncbi:MAG: dgt [Noviherbaspirillum sp.]|nr:dgt [Noviherbaspirillum sp.]